MALRAMNPQYIVCDELGTRRDAAALEEGIASGATFLASVHCDAPESLTRKPQLARLLATGAFGAAVFLTGRSPSRHRGPVGGAMTARLLGTLLLACAGAGLGAAVLCGGRRWKSVSACCPACGLT